MKKLLDFFYLLLWIIFAGIAIYLQGIGLLALRNSEIQSAEILVGTALALLFLSYLFAWALIRSALAALKATLIFWFSFTLLSLLILAMQGLAPFWNWMVVVILILGFAGSFLLRSRP